MPKHTVTIFGSRLTYWEYSPEQTPVIVMVHGFRGTHDGLADIVARLPQYRIIVPDLPPFGESTAMTERPHTMTGYAELMWAFIDHLGLESPVLLGHSMGSLIVSEMIHRRPGRTPLAVLLSPITDAPLKGPRAIKLAPVRLYFWLGAKALPLRLGTAWLKNRFLLHLASLSAVRTRDPAVRRQIHARHRLNYPRFNSRDAMQEAFLASNSTTVGERAGSLNLPVLIVAGAIDDLSDHRSRREFTDRLPNARLVELPRIGHLIHYEGPAEVARLVSRFIDDNLSPTTR